MNSVTAVVPPAAQTGLTGAAAAKLLTSGGANAVADVAEHPARRALLKLWAPVPWMLEAAIVLQLIIGDYAEAGVVALLLVTNAALGFFQEGRAVFYVARERQHLCSSMPGHWLLLSSAIDLGLISTLALSGTLMAPLPPAILACVAAAAIGFALVLDAVKLQLFRRLRIA